MFDPLPIGVGRSSLLELSPRGDNLGLFCVAVNPPATGLPQPGNHAQIDSVALCNRGQRLACRAALDGFGTLKWRELGFPTELHACGHCPLTALASALTDKLALELSDRRQQG